MNSNNVSILESIKQEQHFKSIGGRVDVGKDGPDNHDSPMENPETALQKLKDEGFDLKKNINALQTSKYWLTTTPMIAFCRQGDLLMCRFLLQHGASCTKRDSGGGFPMLIAAFYGKLEFCQWLYYDVGGGGAAEDINQQTPQGWTPLSTSVDVGYLEQAQWLILHGGAQQLSDCAVRELRISCRDTGGGPEIMSWTRMSIAFHDVTFFLFLCGASTNTSTSTNTYMSTHNSTTINAINTTASSSSSTSVVPLPTNLPLLNGHPGLMELIGHYAGLIYGKEIRLLKEFIVLVG